jgi:hypothetical protein
VSRRSIIIFRPSLFQALLEEDSITMKVPLTLVTKIQQEMKILVKKRRKRKQPLPMILALQMKM